MKDKPNAMLRSNLGYYRVSTRYIYLRARLCSNESKKDETGDGNDMSQKGMKQMMGMTHIL